MRSEASRINPLETGGVIIYFQAREYDQAISKAKKSFEIAENHVVTLQWLGPAYEQKGQFEDAIATFQKARETDDTPEMR